MMDKRYLILLSPFLLILFVSAACNQASRGASLTPTPTETPTPTPDVVQQNLVAIQAQSTLEAIEALHQATQNVINARLTATVQAENRQGTQMAATATRQAEIHLQQTQSIENTQMAATMQAGIAIATSTAQAAQYQATSTANTQSTQDALSAQQTQVAIHLQSTVDANAIAAAQRVQEAEVAMAELAAERERMMNKITAVAPYVVGTVIGSVLLFLLIRWGVNEADRRKVFTNSEGVPQGMVDVSRPGGVNLTMTDRMPSPTIHSDRQGNIIFPQAANLALQGQVTTLALLQSALASQKPKQALEIVQRLIQDVPQLPQGNPKGISLMSRLWTSTIEPRKAGWRMWKASS